MRMSSTSTSSPSSAPVTVRLSSGLSSSSSSSRTAQRSSAFDRLDREEGASRLKPPPALSRNRMTPAAPSNALTRLGSKRGGIDEDERSIGRRLSLEEGSSRWDLNYCTNS